MAARTESLLPFLPLQGDSGIYAIRCLATGKFYVGSALSFRARWTAHRSLLRAGQHVNGRLQRAWERHGEPAFTFEVLELVADPNRLGEREQAWIEEVQPELNMCEVVRRGRR